MRARYMYVVYSFEDVFELPVGFFYSVSSVADFLGCSGGLISLSLSRNSLLLGKYKIERFWAEPEANTYLQKYFDKLDNLLLERLEYKKYIERQNKVFDVKAFNKRLLSIKEGLFNAKRKDI